MDLNRWLRAASSAAMAVVVTAAVGCSSSENKFDYLRLQVDGQPILAITMKDAFIRGVVVYFHGVDEDEFALTSNAARSSMTEKLVSAGFAVVASRAGGNAFNDPATLQNYRELGSMALQHYRIEDIYFLAESRGAIAAVNLLASSITPVRGLVALQPEFDGVGPRPPAWPSGVQQHSPQAADQLPPQPVGMVDPLSIWPETLKGRSLRFYVGGKDSPSSSTADAEAFKQRFDSAADVSIVNCGAQETSCDGGDDIAKWFNGLN